MEFLLSVAGVLKTILSLLIVLTIIVLVHEWGHYMAARLMGVRVETFSFGFGKRLFGKQVGETDFRFSLVPFGGYIKMAGDEEWDPDNLKPYEFQAKNRAQKIFILFMGPFMNMLLAFAIFTVINISGVETEAFKNEPPRIGYVVKGSPAEKSGIKPGDIIQSIDGTTIPDWKTLEMKIGASANEQLKLIIKRQNQSIPTYLQVNSVTKHNLGDAGLEWQYKTKISEVEKKSPAEIGQLKAGDIVETINGQPILFFDFSDRITASQGQPLMIQVKRLENDKESHPVLTVTPKKKFIIESESVDNPDKLEELAKKAKKLFSNLTFSGYQKEGKYRLSSQGFDTPAEAEKYVLQAQAKGLALKAGERWILGIAQTAYAPSIKVQYSFFPAMGKAVQDIVNLTDLVFKAFRKIIVGKLSLGNMSGPIEIAKVSSKAMDVGASYFFLLIAFISLQLGIVNLFPIPALDGGHLLIFSLEAILRREFSQKVKGILMNIGFIFLIGLMVFVILNDIAKNLPNGWNSFWPF